MGFRRVLGFSYLPFGFQKLDPDPQKSQDVAAGPSPQAPPQRTIPLRGACRERKFSVALREQLNGRPRLQVPEYIAPRSPGRAVVVLGNSGGLPVEPGLGSARELGEGPERGRDSGGATEGRDRRRPDRANVWRDPPNHRTEMHRVFQSQRGKEGERELQRREGFTEPER